MSELKHTPLNELHLELNAKMVPFAGYSMPVQYTTGIIEEHLHTRSKASIFDVSHMGQLLLSGKDIDIALEKIMPIAIKELKPSRQRYGFFTLENGGILDDLMLARIDSDNFYLVINASRKDIDIPHLKKHLSGYQITEIDNALIALQGPSSSDILDAILPGTASMKFMDNKIFNVDNVEYRVSRSGYTGEDGYEISIPKSHAIEFTKTLLNHSDVKMAGLGARDSLRLESGLCLYGNDIDETTSPVDADLLWAMQKVRKPGGERAGGFIGADKILDAIVTGNSNSDATKRVGFIVDGKIPVRHGCDIYDAQDNIVGKVTSGGFAPTVNAPIAMGYIKASLAKELAIGEKLFAEVRSKKIPIKLTDMPIVPQNYFRG